MSNNSDVVKSLNSLLQGEYMAIESFNNFISKTDEIELKEKLRRVQNRHRDNVKILAAHIQALGGRPDENLGFKGISGQLKVSMDLGIKVTTDEILEKAIEGETKGINMAEKIMRGNLDDQSRSVAGKVLENDRGSIDILRK